MKILINISSNPMALSTRRVVKYIYILHDHSYKDGFLYSSNLDQVCGAYNQSIESGIHNGDYSLNFGDAIENPQDTIINLFKWGL